MSESNAVERARRAADAAAAFEEAAEGSYTIEKTVFDAEVDVGSDGASAAYAVTVSVPMLGAATADRVAPVVEDGWFDTFALRMEDVDSAFRGSGDPDVDVERDDDRAVVTVELTDLDAKRGASDAVAAVQYVEGTYVEGIIPGYEYTEPVTHLLQRAADAAGGSRGGTPL
ncbi:DUF5813 family protein [Halobellus captivus]|uniref:DUF5813 family protein n=1 Tax=Halobellus captivus TaxID=2592614 RepID=UPI0011A7A9CD|nr:DUF5813 family protein [Halobellus captivus]